MIKYEDILQVDNWNPEELQQAIIFYEGQLLQPHDDQEHNWLLRSIDKCRIRMEGPSDWETLFK